MKPLRERTDERLERSKLRAYAEDVFLPRMADDGASKSHLERHLAAVEYLERFVKSPLEPGQIDQELVINFEAWVWRQGISDGRRRDLVESLRRIAAAYTPEKKRFRTSRCRRRVLPEPAEGTLRHYYESVYVPIVLVGRTDRYIDENRAALWRLYGHYGRDVMLVECSDRLLSDHVSWLLDLGLKPPTINSGHTAIIQAIMRDARRRGFVDQAPALRKLPVDLDEPDAWSLEQISAFLAACPAASPRPIAGILDAGDWWDALTRVVWYTSLRRRTILAIRRTPDMDLTSGWLRVPGSAIKTHRGQVFRLGVDALESIARIWLPKRKLLFEFPHDDGTFYKQFHRIREAAGLPRSSANAGCLHLVRRTAATQMCVARGFDAAQKLLGHSSPAVTSRYIDPTKIPDNDYTAVLPALPRCVQTPAGDDDGPLAADDYRELEERINRRVAQGMPLD
jgi:integrase